VKRRTERTCIHCRLSLSVFNDNFSRWTWISQF